MKFTFVAICLVLLFSTANAAQWAVADLGRVNRNQHCVDAARMTFRDLLGEARIQSIRTSSWVVYADGINVHHDAIITCTFGDNRGTRATLVINSDARPIDAHLLKRRIVQIFDGNAKRITQAWIDSFN